MIVVTRNDGSDVIQLYYYNSDDGLFYVYKNISITFVSSHRIINVFASDLNGDGILDLHVTLSQDSSTQRRHKFYIGKDNSDGELLSLTEASSEIITKYGVFISLLKGSHTKTIMYYNEETLQRKYVTFEKDVMTE